MGWKVVVTLARNPALQLLALARRLLPVSHERECFHAKLKCRKYLIA